MYVHRTQLGPSMLLGHDWGGIRLAIPVHSGVVLRGWPCCLPAMEGKRERARARGRARSREREKTPPPDAGMHSDGQKGVVRQAWRGLRHAGVCGRGCGCKDGSKRGGGGHGIGGMRVVPHPAAAAAAAGSSEPSVPAPLHWPSTPH